MSQSPQSKECLLSKSDLITEAALAYAHLGYAVFPCAPYGKRPLIKRGLRDASTDPGIIKVWWRRWPNANLAVLPPPGVLVLDFDDEATAETWLQQYPELREASCTRTPRGGAHYWLMLGKNDEQLTTRTKAADGAVDLRGLGRAYLVTPPSLSAKGVYRWECPLVSPACLPQASSSLLAAITPPRAPTLNVAIAPEVGDCARKYALGALKSEHYLVATTPEGSRNARLNRAAYALGGYVAIDLLTFDEVESVLVAAAATPLPAGLVTTVEVVAAGWDLHVLTDAPQPSAP